MKFILKLLSTVFLMGILASPALADFETDFESDSGWVEFDLGTKCGQWQILHLGLISESHCMQQHQVFNDYEGPLLNEIRDPNGTILSTSLIVDPITGAAIPIKRWKLIQATRTTTVRTPLLNEAEEVIYDKDGFMVYEQQDILYKDTVSGGGTLGDSTGINLIKWGSGSKSSARSFWFGIPAQDVGNGFGAWMGDHGESPFKTPEQPDN